MRNFWQQLIIFIIFFCFFSCKTFAQNIRSTSFDDRPDCEKSRGVWREFGNACVDECRHKLDKFSVCATSVTQGCDCGQGRCWNGETCTSLKDYKKIYDKEEEEERKILSEAKEKRKEAAKINQQEIIRKIIVQKAAQQDPNHHNKDQIDVQASIDQAVTDFKNNQITPAGEKATQIVQPIQKEVKSAVTSIEIPPSYLEKEEREREAKQKEQEQKNSINSGILAKLKENSDSSPPLTLPEIPLP